ncbi:MAG: hypothetical protein JXJ04_13490 [Spirochaetales bacterium]|nr:hypothetical protein [Spirochaetales bacterium]
MPINCVHDFHFIMDGGMKNKLKSLDFFENQRSLSRIIVQILNFLTPVIRREHKWGKQRLSKYMPVCNDPDEIREHVHAYVPGELYRELKLLHQDLNFYSIGQLVRGFIDLFLGFVDVYNDDVFQELENIFARWRSEDEQTRQTPREFLRQLWRIIQNLPEKNRLITVYDYNFSPFWIFRT